MSKVALISIAVGLGALATWLSCSDAPTTSSTAGQPQDADTPDREPSSDTALNTLTPEELRQVCRATLGSAEFATATCTSSALLQARTQTSAETEFRQVCRQRLEKCLAEIDFDSICSEIEDMASPDCEANVGNYRTCTQLQINHVTMLGGCDGDYEELLQFTSPSFEACTALETCY